MDHRVLIHDADSRQWLSFTRPRKIFSVTSLGDVIPVLELVEELVVSHGLWGAGWLSYEASPAFDPALVTHPPSEFPVLWFGLFEQCVPVVLDEQVSAAHVGVLGQTQWSLNSDPDGYGDTIRRIREEIRDGNTYQVNYTLRQYADMDVPPQDVFLGFAANARYGAYIDSGRFVICSASPELFFQLDGKRIISRPMKGTAPRGRTLEQDLGLRDELFASEKNRAENLMIVDMIRNDIGRIANFGSVRVPELFKIEKYPTVWQMTSTIQAETDASLAQVFTALYPCASITGAPKANTMKIINKLEPAPRNVYTGSIGFIRPDMSMQFNVAIRTALIDRQYNQAEYGVGGGIVWDSNAADEYQECLVKSRILSGQGTYTHQLLETMLWNAKDGIYLLDYHLKRLSESAGYFDYKLDPTAVEQRLQGFVESLDSPARIRLLLSRNGDIRIEHSNTAHTTSTAYRLKLATVSIDSSDIYLYHKTTRRQVYEHFSRCYAGYDDVLLVNERGEITESCIANLVIEINDKKYTPPVECGLLAGTYRQFLLDSREIEERIITRDLLEQADKVYLANSVRKLWEVEVDIGGHD